MANYTELQSLPFFAKMPPEALAALEPQIERRDLPAGVIVIREGEAATSMFFLASGSVRVVRGNDEELVHTIVAPTLFGEMALVASTPRLASVVTNEACTVFEITRDAVFAIAQQYAEVRDIILGFHRHRLMDNILSSNPLFSPLSQQDKETLAASFVTQTVSAGTVLLQEGQSGVGLYVLLRGKCEVLHHSEGAEVKITDLVEGDVFGEISIVLFDRNCIATVRAATECVVLFLERELFQSIVMSNMKVREEMIKLALTRLRETEGIRALRIRASLI